MICMIYMLFIFCVQDIMKGICNLNTKSLDLGRKPYKFGGKKNKTKKTSSWVLKHPWNLILTPLGHLSLQVCVPVFYTISTTACNPRNSSNPTDSERCGMETSGLMMMMMTTTTTKKTTRTTKKNLKKITTMI